MPVFKVDYRIKKSFYMIGNYLAISPIGVCIDRISVKLFQRGSKLQLLLIRMAPQ